MPKHTIGRRDALKLLGLSMVAAGGTWMTFYPGPPRPDSGGREHHVAQKRRRIARRVIYLYQAGGPSQLDMFDYRPAVAKWHGRPLPDSVRGGQRLTDQTADQTVFPIAASPFRFRQHGESGAWLSELLPHTGRVADHLCFIKSMHTEAINHEQGASLLLTGHQRAGFPSIGAWIRYGLGTPRPSLPGSVVMISHGTALGTGGQPVLDRYWDCGFLPGEYRPVKFRSQGSPVLFLNNPPGIGSPTRSDMLETIATLNALQHREYADPTILERTENYRLALEMQSTIPELVDLSDESTRVMDMYGPDVHRPGSYARNCLLARRMAERGVRFIQLCHRGWDAHSGINDEVPMQCRDVDQPSAALVQDLHQRGMLEDTLVVFASEFGRTVYSQGDLSDPDYGRDHHPRCFTVWLAGGPVHRGRTYGETDDLGYNVVENPVHIHDFNATLLHALGLDHRQLTYRYQGRDQRLTDFGGNVIREILDVDPPSDPEAQRPSSRA